MFNLGKKKKDMISSNSQNKPPKAQPSIGGVYPGDTSSSQEDFGDFGNEDDNMFGQQDIQTQSRPQRAPQPPQQSNFRREVSPTASSPSKEEVEEISESIVSEKTEELSKKLDEIKSWQKKIISRLDLEEKEIGYLRGGLNGFSSSIVGRLEECRKEIKQAHVEIKVMEKIFSEIMPTFIEKIKELDEISKKLKGYTSVNSSKKSNK